MEGKIIRNKDSKEMTRGLIRDQFKKTGRTFLMKTIRNKQAVVYGYTPKYNDKECICAPCNKFVSLRYVDTHDNLKSHIRMLVPYINNHGTDLDDFEEMA